MALDTATVFESQPFKDMPTSDLPRLVADYHKATDSLFLRQYDSASKLCLSAISEFSWLIPATLNSQEAREIRKKFCALYVNVVAAILSDKTQIQSEDTEIRHLLDSKPHTVVSGVWSRIVAEAYHNEEGEVDGETVVACVLLCISQQLPDLARRIIEDWLEYLPDAIFAHLQNASVDGRTDDEILKCYEKVVELYVVHVLTRLKEWSFARMFLRDNMIIDADRKKVYEDTIKNLENESQRPPIQRQPRPRKEKPKKEQANGHIKSHHNGNGVVARQLSVSPSMGNNDWSMASTTNNHKNFSKASSSSHTTPREASISTRKRGRNFNMKTSPQTWPISRSPDDDDQVSRPTENTFERIMSRIVIIRDRLSPYLRNSLIGSLTSSISNTGSSSLSKVTIYMALVFSFIVLMISRTTRKQLRQACYQIIFKVVPILKAATSIKDF
ncbi:8287_t:CDS:2 [Paraglomus occultum]|uniref:8287_t:CDS:1 n=1 Tax=Paraglomus occultum TaxID=144539 RepID=A0A9N8WTM1_9GLOM|nr:8287_t:CDS:2 [Paraglomus occultum]